MKKKNVLVVMAALIFGMTTASAQTVDDIVSKYFDAIGGIEKINSINSMYRESKGTMFGMDVITRTTILNGVGYKAEMEIMGTVLSISLTTNDGWTLNPKENSGVARTISEEEFNSQKDQIFIENPFSIYKKNGYTTELKGTEKMGDSEVYKINFMAPDGIESEYYFDTENGLLLKSLKRKVNDKGVLEESTTTYSDYTDVDGYLVPFKLKSVSSFISIVEKVLKVELNVPVDEAIFSKPH